jgi:hypothetical protein
MIVRKDRPFSPIPGAINGPGDVASIRASLKDAFNIPDDATVTVNGLPVQEGYVLREGDCVEFHNSTFPPAPIPSA